ncbi:hypothetical protein K523DRAFT_358725 [Schizophyllum commune Tattone D]|nr:hypothetical protein K523DRAFT_358725 [Schizophyllum commune Tattone D]
MALGSKLRQITQIDRVCAEGLQYAPRVRFLCAWLGQRAQRAQRSASSEGRPLENTTPYPPPDLPRAYLPGPHLPAPHKRAEHVSAPSPSRCYAAAADASFDANARA